MEVIVFIIYSVICGFIGAAITEGKGRGGGEGFLLGLILGIIGVIISAILSRNEKAIEKQNLASGTGKKCPYCAEVIKIDAIVCRYCGRDLKKGTTSVSTLPPEIKSNTPSLLENAQTKIIKVCSLCGIPMAIKTANAGQHKGKRFYVCPNHKQCHQVIPVEKT